jgi:hypothetical protein
LPSGNIRDAFSFQLLQLAIVNSFFAGHFVYPTALEKRASTTALLVLLAQLFYFFMQLLPAAVDAGTRRVV